MLRSAFFLLLLSAPCVAASASEQAKCDPASDRSCATEGEDYQVMLQSRVRVKSTDKQTKEEMVAEEGEEVSARRQALEQYLVRQKKEVGKDEHPCYHWCDHHHCGEEEFFWCMDWHHHHHWHQASPPRRRQGSRRRQKAILQQTCDGQKVRIYNTDKQVQHTLVCEPTSQVWDQDNREPSAGVRSGSNIRFVGGNGYFQEPIDQSLAKQFLAGTLTQNMPITQGSVGSWANNGGHRMTPQGWQERGDGSVQPQEAVWVLSDKHDRVILPKWMRDSVDVDPSNTCNGYSTSSCSCPRYQCALMVECCERRVADADTTAKNACNKMNSGTASDHEKKCCLDLLKPCKDWNSCAFDSVASQYGAFLQEDTRSGVFDNSSNEISGEMQPRVISEEEMQPLSLDETITGKRSC